MRKGTAKGDTIRSLSLRPDNDIDLILGRHLVIDRDTTKGYDLAIVSQKLPAGVPQELLRDMRRVLDFYNGSFGRHDRERDVTGVIRAGASPEGTGGGLPASAVG